MFIARDNFHWALGRESTFSFLGLELILLFLGTSLRYSEILYGIMMDNHFRGGVGMMSESIGLIVHSFWMFSWMRLRC